MEEVPQEQSAAAPTGLSEAHMINNADDCRVQLRLSYERTSTTEANEQTSRGILFPVITISREIEASRIAQILPNNVIGSAGNLGGGVGHLSYSPRTPCRWQIPMHGLGIF